MSFSYKIIKIDDLIDTQYIDIVRESVEYFKKFEFNQNNYEINKTENSWNQKFGNINIQSFTPKIVVVIDDIFNQIIRKYYPEIKEGRKGYSLQFYKPGHFIEKHRDGGNGNVFTFILYLNDNWKKEWGGELVLEDGTEILPHWRNIIVLDFQNHNILHEVKEIKENIRYAIYCSFQKN